jgi:hypothetical protein
MNLEKIHNDIQKAKDVKVEPENFFLNPELKEDLENECLKTPETGKDDNICKQLKCFSQPSEQNSRLYFEFMIHYRGENAAWLVALAIGMFTILTLYEHAKMGSLFWWGLTLSYWTTFIAGAYSFLNWGFTTLVVDTLHRCLNPTLHDDMGTITTQNKLIHILYKAIWERFEARTLKTVIWSFLIVGIILSLWLWLVIAFKIGWE